ncbi:GyrI-like domain-containing protein [Microbacterium keratanolyticum]|uniref:GyrI-like domain-containing protein n=1 Tax=Microbacterium keratanolyticum TaxID=67574 RepID=UPI00363073BC
MTVFPDAPFAAVDRIDVGDVTLAVIRHEQIRIDDLRDAFDTGYAALGALFADGTLTPVGPAVAVYYGNPMEVFDLELGFPVERAPEHPLTTDAGVTILGSALPTGPATATTVMGSYDGLGAGWMRLVEETLGQGLSIRGMSIEVYVSDPDVPADELRTDLILPIAS